MLREKSFVRELALYEGENVFNPYSDRCPLFDRHNAASIRRRNLESVIQACSAEPVDAIWIGRDLGHRGGRRTGLALTDEYNLDSASNFWGVPLERATKGNSVSERTAANIWDVLRQVDQKVFMWNVFPFHPHESESALTNRSHTARERDAGLEYLRLLVEILRPQSLVAIGNDAFNCVSRAFPRHEIHKIRHPSYGGEKTFIRQMGELYLKLT